MDADTHEPIHIFGGSLVRLHKILKEEDIFRVQKRAYETGVVANTTPIVIIDFSQILCIQEDYKTHGTIVMDKKSAVNVVEPLDEVLQAWAEVKDNLAGSKWNED